VNPKSERTLLLLLAAIQFITNLDFLIILPLGPQYMRLMHLAPAQFNLIVAAYAIAEGISGWLRDFGWTALAARDLGKS
jgi:MFS family permease